MSNSHSSGTLRRICYLIVMALVVGGVAAMNVLTTLKGDDVQFVNLIDEQGHAVKTLGEFLRFAMANYSIANGRLADITAQAMCVFGTKGLFNVLNTLVTVATILLLTHLARARRQRIVCTVLIALAMLWLWPFPGETMLWLAGACNYLWSSAANLFFMCLLLAALNHAEDKKRPRWQQAAMLTMSVIAGWMHEAFAAAMVAAIAGYALFNLRRCKGLPAAMMVAYLAGFAIAVCAPGIWHRATSGELGNNAALNEQLSRRVMLIYTCTRQYITPAIALLYLLWLWWKHGWRHVTDDLTAWAFVGATASLIALPVILPRGHTWFFVTSLVLALRAALGALRRLPRLQIVLAALGVAAVVASGTVALQAIALNKQYDDAMCKGIEQCPDDYVVLPAVEPPHHWCGRLEKRWVSFNVFDSMHGIYNVFEPHFARNYGKRSVQFIPPVIMERYTSDDLMAGATALPLRSNVPELADTVYFVPGPRHWDAIDFIPLRDSTFVTIFESGFNVTRVNDPTRTFKLTKHAETQKRKWGTYSDEHTFAAFPLRHRDRWYIVARTLDSATVEAHMNFNIDGKLVEMHWTLPHPSTPSQP